MLVSALQLSVTALPHLWLESSAKKHASLTGHSESIVDMLAMPGLAEAGPDDVYSSDAWDRRESLR